MPFQIKKDPSRIYILGTGSGWENCPKESSALYYCLNDYVHIEKYGIKPDLLFILDVLDDKPQIVSGQDNLGAIIKRINDLRVPLIAPYHYEEIPLSVPFPLEKAVEKFGAPYFTNTICYMICFALMEGAKEIELFGVNQASSSEYAEERVGVSYWLGIANGMGVKITINGDKSQVLTTRERYGGNILYGYAATYETIQRDQERFGEGVIKKLLVPPRPVSRTIRKII